MDTVIVPTYNEAENVGELITRLKAVCDCSILVVDDSKDKNATANAAYKAGAQVMQRSKRGLSSAVVDGLKFLSNDLDKVVVMDADLQHPPEDVPKLFEALNKHDFAVASRYIPGGGCNGWDFDRKVISRVANLIARPLVPKVHDPVSGFFGFKREGLPDLTLVNTRGFKIMLELLVRGNWRNVVEVPFVFQPRLQGDTKMKSSQIRDYILQLISLYLRKRSYSLWQQLKVRLLGRCYLEHRTRPGWKGYLPFYVAKCPKHGLFEDYPHGYTNRLDCPICLKERE